MLEAIVHRVPPPPDTRDKPLRALIFDSWYDAYEGGISLVRVMDGEIRRGMKVRLMGTDKLGEVMRLGYFTPHEEAAESLGPGEVGFVVAGMKTVADLRVGDTMTDADAPAADAAGRLQGTEADGLRRALPDRGQPVWRACARR